VRYSRAVFSREEHTIVDDYGRGRTPKGEPSAPEPGTLTPELRLSSGDHKKGLCCLRLRMHHRIQECKNETMFRSLLISCSVSSEQLR
jgi:hypothetical protein